MIDTHCHLCDKRFDKDRVHVLDRARHAGVTHVVEIAYGPGIWERAFALSAEHANVFLCVGVHPSESGKVPMDALAALRDHARHPRVVAIGETGLDFYRDTAPEADQRRAFAAHIELARDTGKPLVIHSRAADRETLAQLDAEAAGVSVKEGAGVVGIKASGFGVDWHGVEGGPAKRGEGEGESFRRTHGGFVDRKTPAR